MKRFLIYCFAIVTIQFLLSCSTKSTTKNDGVIKLFTEGDTTWLSGGDARWSFDNGALTGRSDSGSGFVATKAVYRDFELNLEFKPDSTVNSGVFLRCEQQELSATNCYEINIWDLHPNQDFRTGAVVSRELPVNHVETLNQWNTYRIICQNKLVKAWINDVLVTDMVNEDLKEGYIALQAAGKGELSFRNIELRLLEHSDQP